MPDSITPEWRVSRERVSYPNAVAEMEKRVAEIEAGEAPELFWLLEHPPLYTAGTSAKDSDLLDAHGLPVYKTGRGGQFTWHGPGQRVIYVLRDLRKHGRDVRQHVCALEQWMIDVLKDFGIKGERREGRIGIWVARGGDDRQSGNIPSPLRGGLGRGEFSWNNGGNFETALPGVTPPPPTPPARGGESYRASFDTAPESSVEEKIGAIGVRVRHWITYHGLALNVDPDLEAFKGIVPCGLPEFGVTSLKKLGVNVSMDEVDAMFGKHAEKFSAQCR